MRTNEISQDDLVMAAFTLGQCFFRDELSNDFFDKIRPQIASEVIAMFVARGLVQADEVSLEIVPTEQSNQEHQADVLSYLQSIVNGDFTPVDEDVPHELRADLQDGFVAAARCLTGMMASR